MKYLDDYQEVARDFLLKNRLALLADAPGVGKTGPAIMAAWENRKQAYFHPIPTLITCPAYLIPNWEKEIHDFIPFATVVRADGAGAESRHKAFGTDADFVLTSYNNWSAKTKGSYTYPELVDSTWSAYIFDEGHRLRGHSSATTHHVNRTRLAKSRNLHTPIWCLTGTPFVRDGGDFYTYFHLYDKKTYGSYWRFVDDWCITQDTPFGKTIGNLRKGALDQFYALTDEFMLRRTTKDIPKLADLELLPTLEYNVDMPKSVLKAIQKMKKEYTLEHEGLGTQFLEGAGAVYVKCRQITTVPPTKENPKIAWLQSFLEDHFGKVVVYVWYKGSARTIVEALGERAVLVTGDIPALKRAEVVDDWRTSKTQHVLVATIPSLKEGISLTEAKDVVFLEQSELPADMEQCEKRLCRRGQTEPVQPHYVYAKGTPDDAIKRMLKNRNLGFQQALNEWIRS